MSYILVLYYSRHGATQKMAEQIALGIERHQHLEAKIRTVPSLHNQTEDRQKTTNHPFVRPQDLIDASGLILGSPTRFGNISANLQFFLESTLDIWLSGQLIGKPAGVFTSSDSLHGGQESTLLSMILPLMHHGMLISGIPYNQSQLHTTQSGGTPYGASHVGGNEQNHLTKDERDLCLAFGENLSHIAYTLSSA